MPAPALVAGAFKIGSKLIDHFFPSPEDKAKAQLRLLELEQSGELAEIAAASEIITAEAKSEHWLTANWRPITMLTFVAIIVWDQVLSGMVVALLSVSPEVAKALQPEVPAWMGESIKFGLGGYVLGRSAEKFAEKWKGGAK